MDRRNMIRAKQRWRYVIYSILCVGFLIQVIHKLVVSDVKELNTDSYRGRHLLESINDDKDVYQLSEQADFLSNWHLEEHVNHSRCRKPRIREFPPGLFTESQRRHGFIIVHLAVVMYACIALAIVCDYYFVPSLEVICFHLNIQEDVGGATLMAIGSSAPDICAAIIGVLFTDGDVGIGTIMGASMFNILFVVGFCGVLSYDGLRLTWWPFTRDVLWCCLSIVILSLVIFDGVVRWREALTMIIFYFIYCIMLWQNKRIEKKIYLLIGDKKTYQARFEDAAMKTSLMDKNKVVDDEEVSDTSEDYDYCGYPQDPPENFFECPDTNIIQIISWIVVLPPKLLFFLTIPDLRRPGCQKLVALTFLIGMAWISALTYLLLWMVSIIGYTLDIPESVMGITFVAFGTSVPDWFCSVLVARRGKADMAISQSVASNTLGILFGLGFPWLIKARIKGHIHIESIGMLISCFVTFIIALVVLLVFYCRKFVLSKRLGFALIGVYIIYLCCSVLLEVKLYLAYRLPFCGI